MRGNLPSFAGLLVFAGLAVGCDDLAVAPTQTTTPTQPATFSHGAGNGSPPAVRNFVAPLNPGEEVPAPNLTETKNPTGNAVLRLNGNELSYKLIAANIRNVTQAHIHCGPTGVAGPVVAFLFGFVADGVDPAGILEQGTVTPGDVIPRPSSDACPGGVADFDDLVAQMRAGSAYVNVHTIQNPPGEIRGQIRTAGPGH